MDRTTRTARIWFDIHRHEDPSADPAPANDPQPNPPAADPSSELGDAGKRALDAERKARRDAEKALAEREARIKEFEDRDKSEQEKLEERARTAEENARKAEEARLRAEVALDKGLPKALADRLQGSTLEAMQADADALLALIPPSAAPAAPAPPDPAAAGVGVKGDPPKPTDFRNDPEATKAELRRMGVRVS